MLTTMTLKQLSQKINITPEMDYRIPIGKCPLGAVVDQLFVIDESQIGESCIIDGRLRFFQLFSMAVQGKISWEIELSVKVLDFHKEINSPVKTEFSELPDGILNIAYIRNFLLLHKNDYSEKELSTEILEDLVRKIYRHLLNNLKSHHKNPVPLVTLVADLNSYLIQSDIAKILHRSEGWVSDAIAVSKLPLYILEAMESGQISYSAAVVIARAQSAQERSLLYSLAKRLPVTSLSDALRFLSLRPNFASKRDATQRLFKMFSKEVKNIGGRARLQLQLRIERALGRFFRSKIRSESESDGKKSAKDPKSLVFHLKIAFDGENAEDLSHITPEKVQKIRSLLIQQLEKAIPN